MRTLLDALVDEQLVAISGDRDELARALAGRAEGLFRAGNYLGERFVTWLEEQPAIDDVFVEEAEVSRLGDRVYNFLRGDDWLPR